MAFARTVVAFALIAALAGCLDTKAKRGLAGAAGGAVLSSALGGNAVAGAVAGGAAGLVCDDVGICKPAKK